MARLEDVLWVMALGFAYLMACLGSVIVLAGVLAGIAFVAGDWAMTIVSIIFILAFAYIAGREIVKR
jgi:hypothetical protein